MTLVELARDLLLAMMEKSGVQEWTNPSIREQLVIAAREMAENLWGYWDMATSKILVPAFDGTPKQITFGNYAGDFSPTAANDLRDGTGGNRTDVEIVLAALANSTSESTGSVQSAKFDFGSLRAPAYKVSCAFELAATPTADAVIELWLAPSHSATAGTGNPGNASGASGAYSGYSSNIGSSLKQCVRIGDFVCTVQATGTIQVSRNCGIIVPPNRYGSLIVWNKSGAAFHSDDVECHVVFDPIFLQSQAA